MNEIEKIIAPARHSLQHVPLTESMVIGGTIGKLRRAIDEALNERDRLRKVLEWYADEDNYDPVHLDKLGIIPIDADQGQRAREAIKLTQV